MQIILNKKKIIIFWERFLDLSVFDKLPFLLVTITFIISFLKLLKAKIKTDS